MWIVHSGRRFLDSYLVFAVAVTSRWTTCHCIWCYLGDCTSCERYEKRKMLGSHQLMKSVGDLFVTRFLICNLASPQSAVRLVRKFHSSLITQPYAHIRKS